MTTLAPLVTTCSSRPGGGDGRHGSEPARGTADIRGRAGDSPIPSTAPTRAPTQYSADQGTDGGREVAADLLSRPPMPQNQHITGWGAGVQP
ncbi:hypothetical protein [Streptomyces sp. OE57]|uniref:hypothetical protein n=1 Tax=Streptomyces lacaronensis TaxID=3379885 RepID=UPI0039B76795